MGPLDASYIRDHIDALALRCDYGHHSDHNRFENDEEGK